MSSSSSARIPEFGVGNVLCSQSEDSAPVPSEGLSPQAEWFKYQGKTHTVPLVNIALSNPPRSHGLAGNPGEARNPLRGQEVRNSPIPLHRSQAPSPALLPSTSCHPPYSQLQRCRAPRRSSKLFHDGLMQSPRVDAHEKKPVSEHFPPPSSRVRNSGPRGAQAAAAAPARPAAAAVTSTSTDLQ